jgi:uncharacterized Zn finger protein
VERRVTRWSDRWRGLLDDAGPLRLNRGRGYERAGRVTDLRALPGALSARVQGSRATPYVVEVGLPTLAEHEWTRVVARVAEQARHAARLLACQPPDGLEEELERDGVRLFPHPAEVVTTCGCDDPTPVCKHVVAVLEVAARRLDDDPFLLLRLRGRGRERFLADLTIARSARRGPVAAGLAVPELAGQRWTDARGPLPERDAEVEAGEPLTELGDPPGWAGGVSAADLFGPLIDRAAVWAAQRLAGPPFPRT